MDAKDLRIVFMGTPEFAVPSLRALVGGGYNVVGVVTSPDKPAGRGQKIHRSEVKIAALELGLPVLQPEKLKAPEFVEALEALRGEYQNYRRRTAAQLERAEADGMKKAVLALLPVYDDLARALDAPCTDEAYYHGVELLMQKLLARLDGLGVVPMDSLGKCFNPDYHEAVEHIEDPAKRQDEIVQVIQTGFTMDEMVIRHAKVIVAN